MIGWGDVYKVVAAMAPLYFALGLGYGSMRWWRFFTPDQCDAINRLVAYFAIPYFVFDFAARADPFAMNYRVLAADAISKLVVALALAAWAKCCAGAGRVSRGDCFSWCITGFSLATLNNTLVVGVPLLDAMYGPWARDLIVQLSVVQAVVWFTLLLLAFEARKAWAEMSLAPAVAAGGVVGEDGFPAPASDAEASMQKRRHPLLSLARPVGLKLARNPNVYASVLGVVWSCVAHWWHLKMPGIIEGSVLVMSRTGIGMAMFGMGLFMALQEKVIMCGPGLTVLGMVLRFAAGPATTAVGAVALGLRGDLLRLAIMQAALPQSITTFVFAREYGVHADVLSTAVIFGTLASLPVLITYNILLGFIR